MPSTNRSLFSSTARSANSSALPRWKRVLDLAAIVISSPAWLPVMIFISVWIKLVSKGPIFFKQERIGFRGQKFLILKFRSMEQHAETESHESHFASLVKSDGPMTKLDVKGDRRMISSGWLLRATGLDELPQLFNVLQGDMSLVGPRPCTEKELNSYETAQFERFAAFPGLTGYWQINGKNKTSFSRMIELDVFYARHACLRLDLAILLRTIPALLTQVRDTKSDRATPDKP